jgi:hypothetical protein
VTDGRGTVFDSKLAADLGGVLFDVLTLLRQRMTSAPSTSWKTATKTT